MTASEFARRVKAIRSKSRTLPACRDVLVDGSTVYSAAKSHDVDISQTAKLVRRIRDTEICKSCGQPV